MVDDEVPAGTKMPTPVPEGRFDEFAAALSEGFCPSCRNKLNYSYSVIPEIIFGGCRRCDCSWEHNRVAMTGPVITWRGCLNGIIWTIYSSRDNVFGRAEWAE